MNVAALGIRALCWQSRFRSDTQQPFTYSFLVCQKRRRAGGLIQSAIVSKMHEHTVVRQRKGSFIKNSDSKKEARTYSSAIARRTFYKKKTAIVRKEIKCVPTSVCKIYPLINSKNQLLIFYGTANNFFYRAARIKNLI